jgi:hypothetical protein
MSLFPFLMILLLLGNNFSPTTANSLPTLSKKSMGLNGLHLKLGAIHVSWSWQITWFAWFIFLCLARCHPLMYWLCVQTGTTLTLAVAKCCMIGSQKNSILRMILSLFTQNWFMIFRLTDFYCPFFFSGFHTNFRLGFLIILYLINWLKPGTETLATLLQLLTLSSTKWAIVLTDDT